MAVARPRRSDIAHDWGGTTATERALEYPCDRYLPDADDAYFRALDVAAPAQTLFRWLCQLRAAPYSYDLIDNLGRRSPRTLTPGLEQLEVGQRVMTLFRLVEFEADRHLTVLSAGARAPADRPSDGRSRRRSPLAGLFGDVAVTYMVAPVAEERARLLAKVNIRHPRGRVARLLGAELLPWGDLVMMRRQLLNLRELAEREGAE